ncbi:MAG: hypothetical protein OER86_01280 [Phycisphaerae bacterium]|nr:hypothetical protein [Phycisphaerae bacterium]
MSDAKDSEAGQKPPEPKKKRRRWLKILLVLILLLVLGVVFAPALASTGPGRNMVNRLVSYFIPGFVAIEKLQLSWLKGQRIDGLRLSDPDGQKVIELDELRTGLTLWGAVRGDLRLGETTLKGIRGNIVADESGETNLMRALGAGEPDPTKGPARVPRSLSGRIVVEDLAVEVKAPRIKPVTFTCQRGEVDMSAAMGPIKVNLPIVSRQGELGGKLDVAGKIENLFAADGTVNVAAARADLTARASDLPVEGVDHMLGLGGLLASALGDRLTLDVVSASEAGRVRLSFKAEAPNLSGSGAVMIAEKQLDVAESPEVIFTATPRFAQTLARRSDPKSAITLAKAVQLKLEVLKLAAATSKFNPADLALQIRLAPLAAEPIVITGDPRLGELRITNFSVDAHTTKLAEKAVLKAHADLATDAGGGQIDVDATVTSLFDADGSFQPKKMRLDGQAGLKKVPTALLDQIAQLDGQIGRYLGSEVSAVAVARSTGDKSGTVNLSLHSDRLTAEQIPFTIADDLVLAEAATLRYRLPLPAAEAGKPTLAREPTLAVQLTEISAPLKDFSLARVIAAAQVTVDPLEVAGDPTLSGTSIRKLTAPLRFDGPANHLTVSFSGEASLPGRPGASPLTGNVKLRKLLRDGAVDAGGAAVTGQVKLEKLPTAFIEALSGRTGQLVPLVGPELDITGVVRVPEGGAEAGVLTLTAAAENLKSDDLEFELGDVIHLRSPVTVDLKLTPAGFAAWTTPGGQEAADLVLARGATVTLKIKKMAWPVRPRDGEGDPAFDPSRAMIDLSLGVPQLLLEERASGARIQMDQFQATATAARLDRPLSVSVTGRLVERTAAGEPRRGQVKVTGNVTDLFDSQGRVEIGGATADLHTEIENLPGSLVAALAGGSPEIKAVLGERVELRVDARLKKMNGPVTVQLIASNSHALIRGKVTDGYFTLDENVVAEVQVTPELSRTVLKNINPMLVTAVSAEKPLRVEIHSTGFRVPVRDFEIGKAVVEQVSIDPGKLVLDNGGVLGLITGVLKSGSISREKQLEIWFTPVNASLKDGVATYDRMDALIAGSFQIATWGNVDLGRDAADMVLGFPAATLNKAFGLDKIAPDYVAQFPLLGKTASASFDPRKAALKIAGLLAQSQGKGDVGAVVDIFRRGVLKEKPDPKAPAAKVLPWAAAVVPATGPDQPAPPAPPPAEPKPAAAEKPKSLEQQLLEELLKRRK